MIDLVSESTKILQSAGFTTGSLSIPERPALVLEDETVLGFLFTYPSGGELLSSWAKDSAAVITKHQLALRRGGAKAWNLYTVFLTSGKADPAALAAIEENLSGTRKIARAAVGDALDLRQALLPLLPLQAAPQLEAIDLSSEIRLRSTDVPSRAVDAFLSASDPSTVMQILEEEP